LGIPSVAPLKPKLRSKSSKRLSSSVTGDGMISSSLVAGREGGTKFVDPMVSRRQSKDSLNLGKPIAMPKPVLGKKVPVGQLVALFDGDKK